MLLDAVSHIIYNGPSLKGHLSDKDRIFLAASARLSMPLTTLSLKDTSNEDRIICRKGIACPLLEGDYLHCMGELFRVGGLIYTMIYGIMVFVQY